MKNILICILLFSLSLGLAVNGSAQGLVMRAGLTLPTGNFKDKDEHFEGALTGPVLGVQYLWNLNQKGLMFSLGADAMYNGLQTTTKDYWKGSPNYFEKVHQFINVPVIAGLQYVYNIHNLRIFRIKDRLSFFAEGGIGSDFLQLTNDAKYYSLKDDIIRQYKLSARFGYKAGGGILISDKYYLGCHYFGSVRQKLKYTQTNESTKDTKGLDVDLISLTLGINIHSTKGK